MSLLLRTWRVRNKMLIGDGPHRQIRDPRRPNSPSGPSKRTRAWVNFIEECADWLIDARKRWHDGDPPRKALGGRLLIGVGTSLLALAAIIEKLLGG